MGIVLVMSERVCQVEGCVNCSESSSFVCEECASGLTIAQDGSSCSALTTPPPGPSSSTFLTTSTMASSENNTGRLTGMYYNILHDHSTSDFSWFTHSWYVKEVNFVLSRVAIRSLIGE